MDSGVLEAFRILYAAGAAEGVDVDFRKTLWAENIPDMALFMVIGREKGLQAACQYQVSLQAPHHPTPAGTRRSGR